MKIIQVFFQLNVRGGERVAFDLAREFRAAGVETQNVAFWPRTETESEVSRSFDLLAEGRLGWRGVVSGLTTLARRFRSFDPDAVIVHTTAAALMVAPLAMVLRIPRRVIIHHNPIGTYQDGVWTKLENLLGTLGVYTDIVFVSQVGVDGADRMSRRYRRRVRLIENGIDALPTGREIDFRGLAGVGPGELLVFSVGGLTEQKNHELTITALGGFEGESRYVIAGEGDLEAALIEQADQLGVPLMLLGHVEPAVVAAGIAECDIFAFPSRHEGRALTLLEAAMAGAPIVASDIAENRDVLGAAAIYLPLDDPARWTQVFEDFAADPDQGIRLRHAIGELTMPTARDMAAQYLAILR